MRRRIALCLLTAGGVAAHVLLSLARLTPVPTETPVAVQVAALATAVLFVTCGMVATAAPASQASRIRPAVALRLAD